MDISKKKILNVGCGDDNYGTDFIDIYPKRAEVVKCNVEEEEIPFPANHFDEVYAKFIFEHMKNPNEFLKKCLRVLKKGGRLTVITDNSGCWVWYFPLKFLYSLQHYDNSVREGKMDRHYSMYTTLHLENHLLAAGFKSVDVNYMWFENMATSSSKNFLFALLTGFSRLVSFFAPKKNSWPHLVAVGYK